MEKLKIILLGAGDLACPLLKEILSAGSDDLLLVVTQPDRAAGRGRHPMPCPLKAEAMACGVRVVEPEQASAPETVARLAELRPDVLVVADYGQFLRANLLAVPRLGALNVHPSLLPAYRGASPVQWTLANGETETGVCVLKVTPRMDAGDILARARTAVGPEERADQLEARLASMGAELLRATLDRYRAGDTRGEPQDDAAATFARKLTKEDAVVDWSRPAAVIFNRWRGFSPWPGAVTRLPDGTLLKVHGMRVEERREGDVAAPGTVLECGKSGPLIATGTAALRLTRVQPAGKTVMDGAAFLCGRALRVGDRLL